MLLVPSSLPRSEEPPLVPWSRPARHTLVRRLCSAAVSLELLETVAGKILHAAPNLTPEATISPRTLGLETPLEEGRPVTEGSLPRISLGGELGTSDPETSSADLELVSILGEGGLGRVMLARQRSVGRDVAVKVAHDRERGSAALRVEARTMGRLEHPNVVPVHAIGLDDEGGVVLVMKRVEGVDWRNLLRDPDHAWWARLDVPASERLDFHLDVLAQVANALHFAHEHGVVHRDVKPENVLIGAHGDVYLADWGVASLPHERIQGAPSSIVGTPAYMAPEMVLGDPAQVGARTDVFLLGATLHEILIGRPRYSARAIPAVLMAAYTCEPFVYPESVPEELAALASAATSRDPSARPESALAFRRALDAWRVHRGAIALSRRAQEIADEARALRDSGGAERLADVDRMLVEARFGFTQALREWPEHEAARQGLREVLVLAVENDVARDSVHTARARLAEIDDAPRELVASVEALEAEHAADHEERKRLVAMERDLDLSVASSERRIFFGIMLSVGVLVASFVGARIALTGQRTMGRIDLVGIGAVVLVPILGFALRMRQRGEQNTAGSSVVIAILLGLVTVLANRIIGALAETSIHAILATDCLIYAVTLGATRPIAPRLAWLSLWLALGAIACTVLAPYATAAFGVTMLTTLLAVFVGWSWFMKLGARDDGSSPPK